MLTKRPNPFDEILTWARANRPDTIEYLELLFEGIQRSNPAQRDVAMGLLVSIAFAAGREYGERHGEEQACGEIERIHCHATRWKALARRLFRERVPIARVTHEIRNALVPAEMALERLDAQSQTQRALACVRRVLDFARDLSQGNASARVWRRS